MPCKLSLLAEIRQPRGSILNAGECNSGTLIVMKGFSYPAFNELIFIIMAKKKNGNGNEASYPVNSFKCALFDVLHGAGDGSQFVKNDDEKGDQQTRLHSIETRENQSVDHRADRRALSDLHWKQADKRGK